LIDSIAIASLLSKVSQNSYTQANGPSEENLSTQRT
jgi:hypothetical protein